MDQNPKSSTPRTKYSFDPQGHTDIGVALLSKLTIVQAESNHIQHLWISHIQALVRFELSIYVADLPVTMIATREVQYTAGKKSKGVVAHESIKAKG